MTQKLSGFLMDTKIQARGLIHTLSRMAIEMIPKIDGAGNVRNAAKYSIRIIKSLLFQGTNLNFKMDKPKKLILDYSKMTHQEFYENHFLIDGNKPPPLSSFDKEVLAAFDNLKEGEHICYVKIRGGYKLAKCVQDKAISTYVSLAHILKPAK
jgi:hypothetical protein